MDPSRICLKDDRRGLTGRAFRFGNRVTFQGLSEGKHLWRVEIFIGPLDEFQLVEIDDAGNKVPRQLPPGELFDALEVLSAPGAETFSVLSSFALTGVELRAATAAATRQLAALLRAAASDLNYVIPLRLNGEERPLNLSDQGRRVLQSLADQLESDGHAMASLPAVKRLEPTAAFLDSLQQRVRRDRLQAYRVGEQWFVVVDNLGQPAQHSASAEELSSSAPPRGGDEALDPDVAATAAHDALQQEQVASSAAADAEAGGVDQPSCPPSTESPTRRMPFFEDNARQPMNQPAGDEPPDRLPTSADSPLPPTADNDSRALFTALASSPVVADPAAHLLIDHLRSEIDFLRAQMMEKDRQISAWIARTREQEVVPSGLEAGGRSSERARPAATAESARGRDTIVSSTLDLAAIRREVLQPLSDQLRQLEERLSLLEASDATARSERSSQRRAQPAYDDETLSRATRGGRQPWFRRLVNPSSV